MANPWRAAAPVLVFALAFTAMDCSNTSSTAHDQSAVNLLLTDVVNDSNALSAAEGNLIEAGPLPPCPANITKTIATNCSDANPDTPPAVLKRLSAVVARDKARLKVDRTRWEAAKKALGTG
jgi:hypothetical protein